MDLLPVPVLPVFCLLILVKDWHNITFQNVTVTMFWNQLFLVSAAMWEVQLLAVGEVDPGLNGRLLGCVED